MKGQYPRFKNSYFYEELTEHFPLTTTELEIVRSCRGNTNRQGMAILGSLAYSCDNWSSQAANIGRATRARSGPNRAASRRIAPGSIWCAASSWA
jgi:hypothetical protein